MRVDSTDILCESISIQLGDSVGFGLQAANDKHDCAHDGYNILAAVVAWEKRSIMTRQCSVSYEAVVELKYGLLKQESRYWASFSPADLRTQRCGVLAVIGTASFSSHIEGR